MFAKVQKIVTKMCLLLFLTCGIPLESRILHPNPPGEYLEKEKGKNIGVGKFMTAQGFVPCLLQESW